MLHVPVVSFQAEHPRSPDPQIMFSLRAPFSAASLLCPLIPSYSTVCSSHWSTVAHFMERPCKFFYRSFSVEVEVVLSTCFRHAHSLRHCMSRCGQRAQSCRRNWGGAGGGSLAGAAASIIFVATKHVFCCNESMLLSQQKYFVTTNIILWATKVLS